MIIYKLFQKRAPDGDDILQKGGKITCSWAGDNIWRIHRTTLLCFHFYGVHFVQVELDGISNLHIRLSKVDNTPMSFYSLVVRVLDLFYVYK